MNRQMTPAQESKILSLVRELHGVRAGYLSQVRDLLGLSPSAVNRLTITDASMIIDELVEKIEARKNQPAQSGPVKTGDGMPAAEAVAALGGTFWLTTQKSPDGFALEDIDTITLRQGEPALCGRRDGRTFYVRLSVITGWRVQ